ncbi:MAG: CobW family GTP-binding protein [Myxococcota bacterium]
MSGTLPVTILTGALGAGKTTLLNHLLHAAPQSRVVVIENEYGDVGIDGELIASTADDVVALNEGCICCDVREDLVDALTQVLTRPEPPDRIIIEASGLADPVPVMRIIERMSLSLHLDGVVALVDLVHADEESGSSLIWTDQLCFADLVLLNKADLVDASVVHAWRQKVRTWAPTACVVDTTHAVIDPEIVYGLDKRTASEHPHEHHHDHDHHHGHEHHHDTDITSVGVTTHVPLCLEAADRWFGELLNDPSMDILRMKGILNFEGQSRRFVMQAVRRIVDVTPYIDEDVQVSTSHIVIIGKRLNHAALQAGLEGCCTS